MAAMLDAWAVHVGLNLVFLVPGEQGGMEVYARELLRRCRRAPDLRVTAFVNRRHTRPAGSGRACRRRRGAVFARRRVVGSGEQQLLPGLARRAA